MGSRLPFGMGAHHADLSGPTFPSHLGLNELLWGAGLHGSSLFHPSLLSAFPALAAQAWAPKTPPPPSSLFAQYMMANNPPSAMYPYDLSRTKGQFENGMNLSPLSRGGSGSGSNSPCGRRSDGHASPTEEVINLAVSRKGEDGRDELEEKFAKKHNSVDFLREKAKQSVLVHRSSPNSQES